MAAWKETPKYKVSIVDVASGTAIATSGTYSATPNASGSTSDNVASAVLRKLEFTVATAGKYVIKFADATTSGGLHEFLLLECRLNDTTPVGIAGIGTDPSTGTIFDISGRPQATLQRGINIVRTADGQTHKILVK